MSERFELNPHMGDDSGLDHEWRYELYIEDQGQTEPAETAQEQPEGEA